MNIFIFTGAGSSVELNVPGMWRMAIEFISHLREQGVTSSLVDKTETLVEDAAVDIEDILDDLDSMARAGEITTKYSDIHEDTILKEASVIRNEAEWYIQHVCERIEPDYARQLWLYTLQRLPGHLSTIATSNYDRAVEMAAHQIAEPLEDGFEPTPDSEAAIWCGFDDEPLHKLLKIHGSTDWFHSAGGEEIWKLRHPIPLFGDLTLTLGDATGLKLSSAVVLPSREKKVTQPPYPELMYQLGASARNADIAIFIGTSLRDPDIADVFKRCANRIPTFYVGPNADEREDLVGEHLYTLAQSASMFLISTFPNALRYGDVNAVTEHLLNSGSHPNEILSDVVTATDKNTAESDRLSAIESLMHAQAKFDSGFIRELLIDQSPNIRVYALGLVQNSPDQEELIDYIRRELDNLDEGGAFRNEAELLFQLIQLNGDRN